MKECPKYPLTILSDKLTSQHKVPPLNNASIFETFFNLFPIKTISSTCLLHIIYSPEKHLTGAIGSLPKLRGMAWYL